MATTRITIRQDILARLYPGLLSVSATTTSATAPSFRDSNHTIDVPIETFIGGWIYFLEDAFVGVDIGDTTRIIRATQIGSPLYWQFFISPLVYFAHSTNIAYELHYKFHPEDINDVINDVIRFGTRSTLSSLTADTDDTVFERDVLVDGAMMILKRRLAVGKGAFEAAHLNEEAQYHENKYLSGLIRQGYEPMKQVRDINVSN